MIVPNLMQSLLETADVFPPASVDLSAKYHHPFVSPESILMVSCAPGADGPLAPGTTVAVDQFASVIGLPERLNS
jgi:hypothetical protein